MMEDRILNEIENIVHDLREYLLYLQDSGVETLPFNSTPDGMIGIPEKEGPPMNRKKHKTEKLLRLREKIGDCKRCKLWKHRKNLVFGTGNPCTRLLFIGEAPGEEEDLQGKPFVGKAGELLTKMIEAMGLSREEVYITNVVKCRPPGNRNPEEDEIRTCHPFLYEQIRIISPEIICTLGSIASKTLLSTKSRITELRGQLYEHEGLRIVPTFHPAYLLRNPQAKRPAWKDLQIIMKELGIEIGRRL